MIFFVSKQVILEENRDRISSVREKEGSSNFPLIDSSLISYYFSSNTIRYRPDCTGFTGETQLYDGIEECLKERESLDKP